MRLDIEDYPEELRKILISEVKAYLEYRDPCGWGSSVFKALLIEIDILEKEIKKLRERKSSDIIDGKCDK